MIAARYLYVIYVLNKVNLEDVKFTGPCLKHANGDFTLPTDGVCFLTPLTQVTCTSDHDVALIGKRSGTLASHFHQFFKESVGVDTDVPGFAKSSENLVDTNVYAFTLEYAMPQVFKNVKGWFKTAVWIFIDLNIITLLTTLLSPQSPSLSPSTTMFSTFTHIIHHYHYCYHRPNYLFPQVNKFNANLNLIILEIVMAITKMATFNPSYYNDLLSDAGEFNTRPSTKHNLKEKFHSSRERLTSTMEALEALKKSSPYKRLNFKRQLEMSYIQIKGELEKHVKNIHARK